MNILKLQNKKKDNKFIRLNSLNIILNFNQNIYKKKKLNFNHFLIKINEIIKIVETTKSIFIIFFCKIKKIIKVLFRLRAMTSSTLINSLFLSFILKN